MINLLLSLSLYEFYIFQNEDSYFQPIPYLKYEFNKNSDFNITFHRVDEQFVFGLATAKEIKEIEKRAQTHNEDNNNNKSKKKKEEDSKKTKEEDSKKTKEEDSKKKKEEDSKKKKEEDNKKKKY